MFYIISIYYNINSIIFNPFYKLSLILQILYVDKKSMAGSI